MLKSNLRIDRCVERYLTKLFYREQYGDLIYSSKLEYVFLENRSLSKYLHNLKDVEEDFELQKSRKETMDNVLVLANTLLCENGITPICFKGSILAQLVYHNPSARVFNDVDLVVEQEDFEDTLKILKLNGFEQESLYDAHHIRLNKDNVRVEIHTCFYHPKNNIIFVPREEDIIYETIKGCSIKTLDLTSLLICLLYHQYVHCVNDSLFSDYRFLTHQYVYCFARSLFRYYDIALLINKYNQQIRWEDCYDAIRQAELSIEFKMMVQEFNSIFTDLLPHEFIDLVMHKNYVQNGEYNVYNYIYHNYSSKERLYKIDDAVTDACNSIYTTPLVINCYKNKSVEHIFHIDEYSGNILNPSGSYSIGAVKPQNSDDLSFDFNIWLSSNMLNFGFSVKSDRVCSIHRGALIDNRDMINRCDNVGIVIVPGNGRYKKSDLFVLLEETEEGVVVPRVYDDWVDITDKVNVGLQVTACGYDLDLSIPIEYLGISSKKGDHFIMDLSVSDCDECANRKSTLALSVYKCESGQFKYYAKVQIAE